MPDRPGRRTLPGPLPPRGLWGGTCRRTLLFRSLAEDWRPAETYVALADMALDHNNRDEAIHRLNVATSCRPVGDTFSLSSAYGTDVWKRLAGLYREAQGSCCQVRGPCPNGLPGYPSPGRRIRRCEALARTWASMSNERVQVVPLVLALEWTEEHERIRLMRADSVRMLTAVLGHISDIAVEREKNIAGRFISGEKKRE